jgi:hypothetical protein
VRLGFVDLETSPNIAHVWGLFNQTVSLSQLRESTRVISFAAKERGSKKVHFYSEYHHGRDEMIGAAHDFLDRMDAVCHYNGTRFDVPHFNREFIMAGLNPPSPYQEIDLLKAVRKHFRFTSNKLAHVTVQLGLSGKLSHTGHDLWVRCMAGDEKAWSLMRRYNRQDVVVLEELYDKVLPWLGNHPHVGLIDGKGENTCNKCGSDDLQLRGWRHTLNRSYRRAQCQGCGGWVSFTTSEASVKTRGA